MTPHNRKAARPGAALRGSANDYTPKVTEEPSLFDGSGTARRDAGTELAENAVHTTWRLACEAAISRLAGSGREFSSDDLHRIVGSPPGHASSIGAIILAAARRKEICPTGFKTTERPEGHARPIRTWRGVW